MFLRSDEGPYRTPSHPNSMYDIRQPRKRMLRHPAIAFTEESLHPLNPLFPPDMSLRPQLRPLQILPINRSHQDIQHLRPPFRHGMPRIRNIGPAARTERPRHTLRGLIGRQERVRWRSEDAVGPENFRSRGPGELCVLIGRLEARLLKGWKRRRAGEKGDMNEGGGITDSGEGETADGPSAVVAVADYDEG